MGILFSSDFQGKSNQVNGILWNPVDFFYPFFTAFLKMREIYGGAAAVKKKPWRNNAKKPAQTIVKKTRNHRALSVCCLGVFMV